MSLAPQTRNLCTLRIIINYSLQTTIELLGRPPCALQSLYDGETNIFKKLISDNRTVMLSFFFQLGPSGQGRHDFPIIAGKCSCKAGVKARCKHAAAVCETINTYDDKSCTSRPQEWGKPSAERRRQLPNALADLFPREYGALVTLKCAHNEVPTVSHTLTLCTNV